MLTIYKQNGVLSLKDSPTGTVHFSNTAKVVDLKQAGFTVIELLRAIAVVVAISGALALCYVAGHFIFKYAAKFW